LNSACGLLIQGFSADLAPRGIRSGVFGSRQFPDTFKEKRSIGANVKEIITEQAQNSKVLIYCW
jgi:hypothetical protein